MDMKIGDWVTSYTPGIWRVYRVLSIDREMRFSLSERRMKSRRVVVFSTRLVDAKWRRAFKTESCEQTLIHSLSGDDEKQLMQMLKEEPQLLKEFERYAPEPIDLIVNLSMRVPEFVTLEDFCRRALTPAMTSGMSMEDVLQLLQKANLDRCVGKFPINATLQMVCHDHEMREGEFILRACRSLPA